MPAKANDALIKWAGGKSWLVPEARELFPFKLKTYFEPFFGSGAMFFELQKQRRFTRAVISDANQRLMTMYQVVQRSPALLISILEELQIGHCEDQYYRVRESFNRETDPARTAARLIYLNRTGYNGLYRENKKRQFNVPFGRYKNPLICDAERIERVSRALQGVEILSGQDFERTVERAAPGDGVYFDPPYRPLKAAAFKAYEASGFLEADHQRLATCFRTLARNNVQVVLSSADVPKAWDDYSGHAITPRQVRRNINSKGTERGKVSELVVVGRA